MRIASAALQGLLAWAFFNGTSWSASPPPWWEMETRLDAQGHLAVPLASRSWWTQAQALKVGESFVVRSEYDAKGKMLIARAVGTPVPYPERVWNSELLQEGKEMIVWTLDDDGDMDAAAPKGDGDSDCYVADYGADGTVDRMLDYMDEDGDGDPDVQDIRYFVGGALTQSIMQLDLDDDSKQYPTHDYQRLVGPRLAFMIDAYGDNMYYHNKYDPQTQEWLPFGECPFAFFDTDHDGQSERAVRVSVGPLAFDAGADPDYANSWARMMGPVEPIMRKPAALAVRYSLDIDGGSSSAQPLHYEMGFHMVGAVPYDLRRNRDFHALRRPPRVSYTIAHRDALRFAETYAAAQTGYSWREFPDASEQLGDWRGRADYDQRWEGVFWTWQRRMMHNTGGPNQYWNIRREFDGDPSSKREIYYSPVDHRLHLKGADEGWLPIGAVTGADAYGEIRMYDTQGDGYFDRWEYWRPGASSPYRTASASTARNIDFGADLERAGSEYVGKLLPAALQLNLALLGALESADAKLAVPAELATALKTDISDVERLYLLDIAREATYVRFSESLRASASRYLSDTSEVWWLPGRPALLQRKAQSWSLSTSLALCDAAYERGEYDVVAKLIPELATMVARIDAPD